MKIIHLTDTHLVRPGDTLFSLDPLQRLRAAIDHINAHQSDAEAASSLWKSGRAGYLRSATAHAIAGD